MYRYCPECDQWLETSEYTVDESGETVCPDDGHPAVHGGIQSHRGFPVPEAEFRQQNDPRTYTGNADGSGGYEEMLAAAKEQGLVA